MTEEIVYQDVGKNFFRCHDGNIFVDQCAVNHHIFVAEKFFRETGFKNVVCIFEPSCVTNSCVTFSKFGHIGDIL